MNTYHHVCCTFVFLKIKSSSFGSAFPWDFHELSQSWAPGSAGWKALLNALLKLIYLCVVERQCIHGFQIIVMFDNSILEGLVLYISLS